MAPRTPRAGGSGAGPCSARWASARPGIVFGSQASLARSSTTRWRRSPTTTRPASPRYLPGVGPLPHLLGGRAPSPIDHRGLPAEGGRAGRPARSRSPGTQLRTELPQTASHPRLPVRDRLAGGRRALARACRCATCSTAAGVQAGATAPALLLVRRRLHREPDDGAGPPGRRARRPRACSASR